MPEEGYKKRVLVMAGLTVVMMVLYFALIKFMKFSVKKIKLFFAASES